ncbi:hypothetical protein RND81_03G067200 [Saponaria officinalis]|uniref:Zinc finger GRF-type domain-containing protein n=1 Tax=Saponaria officinalis TaxID=3572 RepID=A0AAW1M679_SAPOF
MDSSHTSSSSKGVKIEKKICPKCRKRFNIRAAGPTATNPFRLYYKCDDCGCFQWCKEKNDDVIEINNGGEAHQQAPNYIQDLKREIKEQTNVICELRKEVTNLSKSIQFIVKLFILMYLLLVYVVVIK